MVSDKVIPFFIRNDPRWYLWVLQYDPGMDPRLRQVIKEDLRRIGATDPEIWRDEPAVADQN